MAKKTPQPTEKTERIYTIPIREKSRPVPIYKKTPKAIKTIKEFLVKHMKIRDRDLDKIKIDKYLNEAMWTRGIKNPPHKIKVKATKEGDIVKVELAEPSTNLKFKKQKEERILLKATEVGNKKKSAKAEEKPSENTEEKKEENTESKEKSITAKEEMKNIEKSAAKKAKHSVGGKTTQPKRQQRVALQK